MISKTGRHLASQSARRLVVAQGVEPTTLDPQNQQETAVANLAVNLFDTLIERDEDDKLRPMLAESYRNIGPTVWEFVLRRGVRFHNGEHFNSDAVKFTFERLLDPELKLRQSAAYGPLSHVEIVDSYTVRLHTTRPWPILDRMMTTAAILAPGHYRSRTLAEVARTPVGSGPYRFVQWSGTSGIELEAHLEYWRSAPAIKSVVFKAIPDDGVRVAALADRDVDLAVNIPPRLRSMIATRHHHVSIASSPSIRTLQLMFYTHQFDATHKLLGPYAGATADRRVRIALNLALDVDKIVRSVLDGSGIRLATPLTRSHFGFDDALRPYAPDPPRARMLLADAGYRNGFDVTLNAPRGRYMCDVQVAEAIAEMFRAVGVRTTVQLHDWNSYLNNLAYPHKAGPMWLFGWGTSHYDAETVYVPLFRSGKPLSNYANPRFDVLLDKAQTIMDSRKRGELYHLINREWLADAPAIPLYQQIDLYGVSSRLRWRPRTDERLKAFHMALTS